MCSLLVEGRRPISSLFVLSLSCLCLCLSFLSRAENVGCYNQQYHWHSISGSIVLYRFFSLYIVLNNYLYLGWESNRLIYLPLPSVTGWIELISLSLILYISIYLSVHISIHLLHLSICLYLVWRSFWLRGWIGWGGLLGRGGHYQLHQAGFYPNII